MNEWKYVGDKRIAKCNGDNRMAEWKGEKKSGRDEQNRGKVYKGWMNH